MKEPTTSVETTTYRTKDMNLAAFIWCQTGVKLLNLQGQKPGEKRGTTIFFEFALPLSTVEVKQLEIAYMNGETRVEPQMFAAKQSNLRDLLHNSLGIQTRRAASS